ncbi:hydrogenase expression/formation protein HypE [Telluria beijingensis]|uniref:hydrogenase expression/formation protein HypE n=1 Tax=Telluria beijingensis TaxID=3068633 RepID=UPI0027953F35|nr:hydrogenase expression/formation protein HypE [Massilia sp. REN29]
MTPNSRIQLAHGNGGRLMRELIETVFVRHLANPCLDTDLDGATVPLRAGHIVLSTDAFTVQPLEFPGGDIGKLAVNGTVNDLAVAGATPQYLTLNAIIEEGFAIEQLDRIVLGIARAARAAQVAVVAGDTKVVRRGEASGLYLATTGVGLRPDGLRLGMAHVKEGDRILVSGPVGDHGTAVLLAREEFGLAGELKSDCANVIGLAQALLPIRGLRFMRDPTRGGLATVCHELCRGTGLGIVLGESAIPVFPEVRAVCDMLGYDPLYLACEGRVVAVVAAHAAAAALTAWRSLPEGRESAIVGAVSGERRCVMLRTALGGERYLEELEDDPLPRIC